MTAVETYRFIVQVPAVKTGAVIPVLEEAAALTFAVFGFSYLSLWVTKKIVDREREELEPLLLVGAIASLPAALLGNLLAAALDLEYIETDRLEELEEKAEKLDELYEIENDSLEIDSGEVKE